MLIKYDRIILEQARKISASPTALQKDLARYLHDEEILKWYPDGPVVSYLAPEARAEIMMLMRVLPRRATNSKAKKRVATQKQ